MKKWFSNDDLTEVLNIKGQLRQDLLDWIAENYSVDGKDKQIKQLVNLTIDTFLDEDAEPHISLNAPSEEAIRHGDFYTEDIDKGDILSFIDKALSFGYAITGPYPRSTYRKPLPVKPD